MDGTHAFRIVSDSIISSICHPPSVRHCSGDSVGSKHAQNARERAAKHAVLVPPVMPTSTQQTQRDTGKAIRRDTIRHDTTRHALRRHDASEKADAATGRMQHTTRLCRLCRLGGFLSGRTAIYCRCDRIVTTHGKTTLRRDASDGTHAPDVNELWTG